MKIEREIVAKFIVGAVLASLITLIFNSGFGVLGSLIESTVLEPVMPGVSLLLAGTISWFAFELNDGVTISDGPMVLFILAIIATLGAFVDIFTMEVFMFGVEDNTASLFASRLLLISYAFLGLAAAERLVNLP